MRLISGSAAGGATSDLAIIAGGQTLDFYLSPKRNVAAAKRFLAKALRSNASAGYPRVINTDKAPSLLSAISMTNSSKSVMQSTGLNRNLIGLSQVRICNFKYS
ncbi:transposase [Corynebacterium glutamicum]|nr:transposase [Corynebacterium glutamicum]AIK89123.1 transposase [Corynebacterium glutamicum]